MGEADDPKVQPGEETRPTFVGVARSFRDEPPTLNDAFASAAGQAMEAEIIGGDRTAWFDVTFVEVELGNQHPRAYRVGVTPKGPPGG